MQGVKIGEVGVSLFQFTVPVKLSGNVHWTVGMLAWTRNNIFHGQAIGLCQSEALGWNEITQRHHGVRRK